jgi:MFS transporter, PAT family, beta-lactamase induction signal transducer AmpG
MTEQGSSRLAEQKRSTLILGSIAAVLYLSEGLPYGIVTQFAPMYLRFHHVDLTRIGLISAVGFAWTVKFLWSPLVDTFATYKRWISAAILAVTVSLAAMAMTAAAPGAPFYALLVMLSLASATQDIAVDAFTIRITPPRLLGPVNSIRVTAYRIALTIPGFLGWIAQSAGWPHAYATAAIVAALIFVVSLTLPEVASPARLEGTSGAPDFIGALKHWLTRDNAGLLLAIAFTYRLGEFAIVSMIKPYWVDRGYKPGEIGTITSIVGVIVSIIATVVGGALLPRIGMFRGLLWFGAMQSLSNIGYAAVAATSAGRWSIYAAAIIENIGYGLGTAAFLAFLMSLCDRERAATEFALLSAAYGLTGTIMTSASGWLAQHIGYASYFTLTVFLGIPALLLIPMVRDQIVARESEA